MGFHIVNQVIKSKLRFIIVIYNSIINICYYLGREKRKSGLKCIGENQGSTEKDNVRRPKHFFTFYKTVCLTKSSVRTLITDLQQLLQLET